MMLFDADEVIDALGILHAPGDVFEVRILEGADRRNGRGMTWGGYFDDVAAVVAELGRFYAWHGCYVTINPVDPLLLHKRPNRFETIGRGESTDDGKIAARRWIPIDCDPVIWGDAETIKGIAATEAEKAHATARRDTIVAAIVAAGLPAPVVADSGNGAHALIRVDLPTASPLVERVIKAVAHRFGDDAGDRRRGWNRGATVDCDVSVFNPARIWKVYGTLACKGGNVGDRPWRMARIVDVPIGGADVADVAALEAWASELEALPRLGSVLEGADAGPMPAPTTSTSATRASSPPSAPGDFDAVAFVEAAGYSLGAPKGRSDGATFREFAACPCPRKTERKAFLSVSSSGALGLGCQHGTCENSRAHRSPGDSWRAFRSAIDPDYGQPFEPAGDRHAAAAAAARSFGDRHATGEIDVDGLVGGDAPPVAPAAAAPAARAKRRRDDDDGRRRVVSTQDARDLRDEVLEALAESSTVYVSQGELATYGDGRMLRLRGGALDSAVVDVCRVVKPQRDRSSGEWIDRPDNLPVRVRGMLESIEAVGADATARFRLVDQVTRSPFWTPAGLPFSAAGHCAEARTLLVAPPTLIDSPEICAADCLTWLRDALADFPFEGGVESAEVSNLIGAMLVPMVRPMIAGPVPMLIIEGNVPGLGKSILASMIRQIYGLAPKAGSLPREERDVAALIVSILRDAEPVHVFDDVTHTVVSASLNRVLTGRSYSDRILGASETGTFAVLQLWIATLNNARVSEDLARRVYRCKLRFDGDGRPEDRKGCFRTPDFSAWVDANRIEILSRLWQMVAEWVAADRPMPAELPAFGSFESFATVVGGILRFAGDTAWLSNADAVKDAVTADDDWAPFVACWARSPDFGAHWNLAATPGKLWKLAKDNDLLGSILGNARNDHDAISRIGWKLREKRDRPINGWRIVEERDPALGSKVYRIESATKQRPLDLH
jgi:hypothetical protein